LKTFSMAIPAATSPVPDLQLTEKLLTQCCQ
jgi:hypothetical protein